ncbi:MAG: hypothetical protein EBR82_43340 [Caulobacteraceae bacterium]|jgi:hypothetical protein|nr:hypothetical protein [Caulobacteraceae bacterium]NDC95249.1 hypothetical protein [bacterium]NDD55880.1 hypothetical protein [bacterium]NDG19121.1 hypothetical protein [Betaproteobacteria bacterium]
MSEAVKTKPRLWEAAKKQAVSKLGGHSARAMQLAVKIYKEKGGGYKGEKSPSNALSQWTKQDWRTKSGKPSKETGERYLPAKAIQALSPAEYAATSRAKRAGGGVGKTVKQPAKIAKKVARYT